jgi:hypothetical protein
MMLAVTAGHKNQIRGGPTRQIFWGQIAPATALLRHLAAVWSAPNMPPAKPMLRCGRGVSR